MRINEDFIENIDSGELSSGDVVQEAEPRNYESFPHNLQVTLTSMKYKLMKTEKFNYGYIKYIVRYLKSQPYINDFSMEVQQDKENRFVDYDPEVGNMRELLDFHANLEGTEVFYRFGLDIDKTAPFSWFYLTVVKILRILNSEYSTRYNDVSSSDYRYNALIDAEFAGNSFIYSDRKIDDRINTYTKLLPLYNRWREAGLKNPVPRDVEAIMDFIKPVYAEDRGLMRLALCGHNDNSWQLMTYTHEMAKMNQYLEVGTDIQDRIVVRMSEIMDALSGLENTSGYIYYIKEFKPDIEREMKMVIVYDDALTPRQLSILDRVMIDHEDTDIVVDCPAWDINDMIEYFKTMSWVSGRIVIHLHINRIGKMVKGRQYQAVLNKKPYPVTVWSGHETSIDTDCLGVPVGGPGMDISVSKRDLKTYMLTFEG